MLLHRSVHRPLHSPNLPNNTSDFNSDIPLTPSESPLIDSSSRITMPTLLVNRAPVLSDHSHDGLHPFPTQAYLSPGSTFTWPRSEQSVSFGHTSFHCRTESNTSALRSQNFLGDVEDEAKRGWNIGPHQQLPTPFPSLSSSFNNNENNNPFEAETGLNPPPQLESTARPPFLSTTTQQSQLPTWAGFTNTNGYEELKTRPRYNPPQAYSYDSTPSLASSLYATSSDLRTPDKTKLHGSLSGTHRSARIDSESESEGKQGEPPYAKLIYRALMDAPEHQMVLKDIYEWIARNTDKAKDPAFKGWQNSVRHNLSMNGVGFANHR